MTDYEAFMMPTSDDAALRQLKKMARARERQARLPLKLAALEVERLQLERRMDRGMATAEKQLAALGVALRGYRAATTMARAKRPR